MNKLKFSKEYLSVKLAQNYYTYQTEILSENLLPSIAQVL